MSRRAKLAGLSAGRRAVLLALSSICGGLAIPRGWAWAESAEMGPATGPTAQPARIKPSFPLAVAAGRRYLVDATGKPFLIHGDTAWSLIAQLTRENVDLYLNDRSARGFNTILISLIEAKFATKAPANAYGQMPFLLPADYSTPNEAYFSHADWVLRRAAERGFLVLLTPSYTGWKGREEGWYRAMAENGPERLHQYGEYLGRRYRDFTNILWVHAGDYNPPQKNLVRAIALGIQEHDLRALHTAHGASGTAALDYWQGEPWLKVNTIYTYKLRGTSRPVYAAALEQYARVERMPFFLIESGYENNKDREATEQRLRMQAYQAVLSGAAGHIFGNNPVWHFDGPGLYPTPTVWQQALGSRGAQSMTHLRNLLAAIPWWHLEPDADNTLLIGGLGAEHERAVAARSADRSFAILYLPTDREIAVDLGQLAGPRVAARWYDPANGCFSAVKGSPFPAAGSRRFQPGPADNGFGFDDRVLILEAQS
jgi:Protein of unknown function (DUF4038)/Putative collagen-binding domain of a collagenase